MASFKVGQRVRRVKTAHNTPQGGGVYLHSIVLPGAEGTVEGLDRDGDCYVRFDSYPQHAVTCYAWTLEPLTPPAEDAWAADKVKQVTKPQHVEPVAPESLPTLREVLSYYDSLPRRKPLPGEAV
jgi:hypothetical protein